MSNVEPLRILDRAKASGMRTLQGSMGYQLLEALGVRVPRHIELGTDQQLSPDHIGTLEGERVVVKGISPTVIHKRASGAIEFVARDFKSVSDAFQRMKNRTEEPARLGFLVEEVIPYDLKFGGEFLLSLNLSHEFGPTLTLASGGTHAELLADHFRFEGGLAVLAAGEYSRTAIDRQLQQVPAYQALKAEEEQGEYSAGLVNLVDGLLQWAARLCSNGLDELEINPLILSGGNWVAVDVLGRIGNREPSVSAHYRSRSLKPLLHPKTIAIAGVSNRVNPGRTILQNLLDAGFPRGRVLVLKEGESEILGCRCVPDLEAVSEPVDLLVVAIPAEPAARLVAGALRAGLVRGVILISGGFEELPNQDTRHSPADRIREAIQAARREGQAVLLTGGNCLGIRSIPGNCDTFFIPSQQLNIRRGPVTPMAFISQSGAFAAARLSRWRNLNPAYVITVGNQLDLTLGDYLAGLKDEPGIRAVGVYIEGFRSEDGRHFMESAREIVESGRPVVCLRAGQTRTGRQAAASHTAVVGGDPRTGRIIGEQSGILWADSVAEFEDLIELSLLLDTQSMGSGRVGALSNAGFECVAIADALGSFRLARFSRTTIKRLEGILKSMRLDRVVAVQNPLDVTPLCHESGYEQLIETIIADQGVDLCVVGCVPLTPAVRFGESSPESYEVRMGKVAARSRKPVVFIVDGEPEDSDTSRILRAGGHVVFRNADYGIRILEKYFLWRAKWGKVRTVKKGDS